MTTNTTWIVENLDVDAKVVETAGDLFQNAIIDKLPSVNQGWADTNSKYLLKLHREKLVTLVTPQTFDPNIHANPQYVISIGRPDTLFSPISLLFISSKSIQIIQKFKIPIILFYPFEYYWAPLSMLTYFIWLMSNDIGCNVSVTVISLVSYYDSGNKIPFSEVDNTLHDVHWVPSTAFLTIYNKPWITAVSNTIDDHIVSRKSKMFICLNNLSRKNRELLTQALFSHNLVRNNIVSLINKEEPANIMCNTLIPLIQREKHLHNDELSLLCTKCQPDILDDLRSKTFKSNPAQLVQKLVFDLQNGNDIPHMYVDDLHSLGQHGHHNYNRYWQQDWYTDTWCSIITETFFDEGKWHSPLITEKTIKPIVNCHPFVIFGHQYSHMFLQELGFKTFEQTWFGLPPDGWPGNQTLLERLSNIIDRLHWLYSLTHDELAAKWKSIEPDLIFNRNHFLTTDWGEVQIKLFQNRI